VAGSARATPKKCFGWGELGSRWKRLVITVVNRGDVTELLRYVAFERNLRFDEAAIAEGSHLRLGLAGAFRDADRARLQRRFGESRSVDIGIFKEFEKPLELRPRGDWVWKLPLDELCDHDWRRGCSARVRLATGRDFEYPKSGIVKRIYARFLQNALSGLPETPG
jgi:hypothetical protein